MKLNSKRYNGVLPFIGGIHRIVIYQDVLSIRDRQLLQASKTWTPNTIAKKHIEPAVRLVADTNDYILGNAVLKNPVTGKVVALYQHTRSHFEISVPCDVYMRTSIDGGLSYSDEVKLWDDNINKKSIYGLYLPTGRLVALYTEYSRTETVGSTSRAGMELGAYSRYSDDDGVTWSAKTAITGVPAYFVRWLNYENPIVGSDGNIYGIAYGINGKLDTQSSYAIHIIKSTNNGVSFAFDKLIYQDTTYVNESSIIEGSANIFWIVSRDESNLGQHRLFKWDKTANTVTAYGLFSLDGTTNFAHPPMIRLTTINGQKVVAYYFNNRVQRRLKVFYCKLSDLETNNKVAFTGKTRWFIMSMLPERELSGYMNVIHTSGLEGIGAYSNEKGPTSTNNASSMRCELVYFNLPTNHQATIIAELGL
ncbi:sialidase family protein [Xanthocytophaga agilis]|uniref:Sialidase family protein n=1 Tax=Xanthocytophaga agilis TaxID=3048010 RepID=A0AAE3UFF1_9BACT|nr:sialidase family protein [Xanthocytophaga agilis]MDJ1500508.1 sialidase family protein [Xanthocytophaga agilis]